MIARFLLVLLTALMLSCGGSLRPTAEPDRAFARAAFVHMSLGIKAAATRCTGAAQNLATMGLEDRSVDLFETCTRRLIPARDALVFTIDSLDPWNSEAATRFGCSGKAVRTALEGLRADFAIRRIETPALMIDAIRLGAWSEQWADRNCDPLHPTTTVTVTIDKRLPPLQPDE